MLIHKCNICSSPVCVYVRATMVWEPQILSWFFFLNTKETTPYSFEVSGAMYSAPLIEIEQVRTLGTHFGFSTCMLVKKIVA